MTTPDQNEARREAIQSLGDVISELPGILHPYNTATAVYAAGWRPPLSTPEASDDERYEDSADYAGSVEWLRELGVVPVAAKMFLDDVIKSARRGPVPEASDDEVKVLESAIGEVHFSQWEDVQERVMQSVADAVLAAGFRRSPVPADTPSEDVEVLIGDLKERAEFSRTQHGDDAWWRGHAQGLKDAVFEVERSAAALESATTVTDARVQRLREACYAQGLSYPTITEATTILTAALTEGERR